MLKVQTLSCPPTSPRQITSWLMKIPTEVILPNVSKLSGLLLVFFRPNIFETAPETFLRDRMFSRSIPRLFFETQSEQKAVNARPFVDTLANELVLALVSFHFCQCVLVACSSNQKMGRHTGVKSACRSPHQAVTTWERWTPRLTSFLVRDGRTHSLMITPLPMWEITTSAGIPMEQEINSKCGASPLILTVKNRVARFPSALL